MGQLEICHFLQVEVRNNEPMEPFLPIGLTSFFYCFLWNCVVDFLIAFLWAPGLLVCVCVCVCVCVHTCMYPAKEMVMVPGIYRDWLIDWLVDCMTK